MATVYKATLVFNANNHGVAMNSFVWKYSGLVPLTDNDAVGYTEDWLVDIFAPLRPLMDSGYALMSGVLDEIDPATGLIVRHVGGLSPSVSGSNNADMLPAPDAGSALARTNIPRVRGMKRFGGFVEGQQTDGLFINSLVSALATATANWLLGPNNGTTGFNSGVWSSKAADFVPFANTGMVTNVPGTQVSRKPGRGA